MKITPYLSVLVLLYIVSTSVLRTSGAGVLESNADRVVFADFVGIALIVFVFALCIKQKTMYINKFYTIHIPLFLTFLMSGLFAISPNKALIEISAILLGFLVSLSIYNILIRLKELDIKKFFRTYVIILGLIALIFILDFLIFYKFSRPVGGLTGTFRNTGQAGSFLGVHLAIILSLVLSGIVKSDKKVIISLILLILALFFTLKRAAIIGFIAGFFILLIRLLFSDNLKDKKLLLYTVSIPIALSPILLFIFKWAWNNITDLSWRFEKKFSDSNVDEFENSFIAKNIDTTFQAFDLSPFLGVGLANVREATLFDFEIHSSYLSMLATSGLVGLSLYLIILFFLLISIFKAQKSLANEYNRFFYYFLPMFIGLLLSWSYTNHLRKREYWIMIAVVFTILKLIKIRRTKYV